MRLKDRVALVTGAQQGIGAAGATATPCTPSTTCVQLKI